VKTPKSLYQQLILQDAVTCGHREIGGATTSVNNLSISLSNAYDSVLGHESRFLYPFMF